MTPTVVLFSGNRVDAPDRSKPRFPPECETKARLAIAAVLQRIANDEKTVLGIAGAADGGDILFHEVCAELGIESEVCLALPADEYVRSSVQDSWAERFYRVLETHPTVTLEAGSGDVWLRDREWQWQRARERSPRRVVLMALQGKFNADDSGGTSGMVHIAHRNGAQVIHLDTREICG